MNKRKVISHDERHELRRRMADAIKAGTPVEEVIREYRVSLETLRRACIEFGVVMRPTTAAAA